MQRQILLLLLLCSCLTAYGQRIRFTDTNNTWKVRADGKDYLGNPFTASFHYYYDGDTVIYGQRYQRLASYSFRFYGTHQAPVPDVYFIREDSVAGRVWSRSNRLSDTVEKLIYNASWALNDSVMYERGAGPKYYINSIDSTQINGAWYRVFGLRMNKTVPAGNYAHVIEGLGSTAGPGFAFTAGLSLESSYSLQCFYNQGQKPALSPVVPGVPSIPPFSNTSPCNLAVPETAGAGTVTIVPNPATSASYIKMPFVLATAELHVFDATGRIIAYSSESNTSSIALPPYHYVPGLYYFRITDRQSGESLGGRFIYR